MQMLLLGLAAPFIAAWQVLALIFRGFLTILASAYLLLLYGITIWLVVGSLSAIQLQEDLPDDDSVSFARVEEAMGRINVETEEMFRRLEAADKIGPKERERNDLLQRIANKLEIEPNWSMSGNQYLYYILDSDKLHELVSTCFSEESNSGSELASAANCDLAKEYVDTNLEYELLINSGERDDLEDLRIQTNRNVYKLDDKEPLAGYFDNYRFFRWLRYDKFLQAPSEILVLTVTIVMGMLGSIVSLTWSFIRSETLSLRRFVLMPFVGMMSAFIILVLVKAGQITITSGDANDSLSPFFLSFVGIISGLLSERAYIRISEVGSNFFSVKDDQPRYGVRLREALEGEHIDAADLGRRLNMAEADISSLLAQTRTASLAEQNLISAYLRRNVRDIFTDLPPVGVPGQAETKTARVPRLIGMTVSEAEATLLAAGLALGSRRDTPSTRKPAGQVVTQSLQADDSVVPGSSIDIEVASPPTPDQAQGSSGKQSEG
jgi:PASTA domain